MRTLKSLLALPVAFVLAACQTAPSTPITTVERVDLERFMGDWYVECACCARRWWRWPAPERSA